MNDDPILWSTLYKHKASERYGRERGGVRVPLWLGYFHGALWTCFTPAVHGTSDAFLGVPEESYRIIIMPSLYLTHPKPSIKGTSEQAHIIVTFVLLSKCMQTGIISVNLFAFDKIRIWTPAGNTKTYTRSRVTLFETSIFHPEPSTQYFYFSCTHIHVVQLNNAIRH